MEKNGIWHSSFRIPAYMVGTNRKANLVAICNLLQEVAGEHAQLHHLGYEDMQHKGQFWVLNRLRVKVTNYPDWKSTVELRTWVNSMKGPFSYRNFSMYNEQGQVLLAACSLWVLMDAESRRPVRILKYSLPVLENAASLCGQPEKLKPLNDSILIATHKVKPSDLDMVGHVNNVKYLEWMLDALDGEFDKVKMIDVNYLQESFINDEVDLFRSDNGFAITGDESKEDICRMRFQ